MTRQHITEDGPKDCTAEPGNCPIEKLAMLKGEAIIHCPDEATANKVWAEILAFRNENNIHTSLKKKNTKKSAIQNFAVINEPKMDEVPSIFKKNKRLFTGMRISGHIDVDMLDENSYKEFGFQEWDTDGVEYTIQNDSMKDRQKYRIDDDDKYAFLSTDWSRYELNNISDSARGMISYYTSEDFMWINSAIYRKGYYNAIPDTIDEALTKKSGFDDGSLKTKNKEDFFKMKDEKKFNGTPVYVFPHSDAKSKELLSTITNEMDESFDNMTKMQKIVYRGASSEMFKDNPEDIEKWLNENRHIGNVVTFDGYTSTTYSFMEASNFSGVSNFKKANENVNHQNRVIYEILTPEGIPVDSISEVHGEDEVLLPRQQKYVVVGRHQTDERITAGIAHTYHVVQMVAVDENNNILDGTNSIQPTPLHTHKEN